jgi:drug/metabolite transporter (DMT)-like permease
MEEGLFMDLNKETNQKRNIIMADIGLLLVALFWGGGFVAGKFALQDMGPLNIMAYRYAGAAIIMAFFCLRKFKLINKKMILCAAMVGFLMFFGNTIQTIGLQYTTPGKQSFIISLYTVLVPLLSWVILKTKPSKKIIAAAFIALFGIALLTLKDDFTIGLGDFLTFLFAITFSLQVVLIGIFMKDMDATLFTFLQIAAAAVFSAVTALLLADGESLMDMRSSALCGLLYLMTFNTAFAFLLQNLCQRFAPANHTAIILSTETVFGTIFAITLTGEVFRGRMIIGCAMMLTAIVIAEFPSKVKKT